MDGKTKNQRGAQGRDLESKRRNTMVNLYVHKCKPWPTGEATGAGEAECSTEEH